MERKGVLLAGLCVLLCMTVGAALAEPAWVKTEKGTLNVRSKANSKSTIVYKVPNGGQVEVLGESGEWSRIEYKGKKGYVKTGFLSREAPEEKPKEEVKRLVLQKGGYARITTQSGMLNVRKKEDAKSVVVAQVKNGMRVGVVEATLEWTQIAYGGKKGYVQTQYLALDSQMIGRMIYPDGDYLYIREEQSALSRSLMTVPAAQPVTILQVGEEWVWVDSRSDTGEQVQGYVSTADIALWRETPGKAAKTPVQARLELSSETLTLGEELEVSVFRKADVSCGVRILRNGKTVMPERAVSHDEFYYRPRAEGVYQMELIARATDGTRLGTEVTFTVKEGSGAQQTPDVYSQKDGWWLDKKYSRSNLDQSGCAIFALSHALEQMGKASDRTTPDTLARTYPMYLAESGTVTGNLLAAAGRDFGFKTDKDKVYDRHVIAQSLEDGAVCSFAIVSGHIALAYGLSEDGTKALIMDSAPSATVERIVQAQLYREDEQGGFVAIASLDDFPEAKYYIETDQYGGLTYALDLDYVAGRGVRLIKP